MSNLLEKFSNGRCTAKLEMRGNSFEEAIAMGPRWFPRVAGEGVQPTLVVGFETKEEALNDARSFRERCKTALAKQRSVS